MDDYAEYEEACAQIREENAALLADSVTRWRGALTLPADIRRKYGIEPGDTFRIIDLDGMFILTPMVPKDLSILVAALRESVPGW